MLVPTLRGEAELVGSITPPTEAELVGSRTPPTEAEHVGSRTPPTETTWGQRSASSTQRRVWVM